MSLSLPIEPKWEPETPFVVNYTPSDDAKKKWKLDDHVRLDIEGFVREMAECYTKKAKRGDVSAEDITALKTATTHGLTLLFSVRSLDAIYRLFIDEAEEITSRVMVPPDSLYSAFDFLMNNMKHLEKSFSIQWRPEPLHIVDIGGLASSSFDMNITEDFDEGVFHLNVKMWEYEHAEEFQMHLIHYMAVTIARAFVLTITASNFGHVGYAKITPDLKKYKIETKHYPNPLRNLSIAWERRVFSALSFADFQTEPSFAVKAMVLDVFEEKDGHTSEYFALPTDSWLDNLLKGCQAETLVTKDSIRELYPEDEKTRRSFKRFFSGYGLVFAIR